MGVPHKEGVLIQNGKFEDLCLTTGEHRNPSLESLAQSGLLQAVLWCGSVVADFASTVAGRFLEWTALGGAAGTMKGGVATTQLWPRSLVEIVC